MILFCYDGSPDAQAAIDHGARLMPGAEAIVLTIWQPFVDSTAYSGAMGLNVDYAGAAEDAARADATGQELAHDTATEGAHRAGQAGLVAGWRVAGRYGAMSSAIIDVAADVDADVIVCGTRGRSGVKSFLLGSVSHDVVQRADRPVLVVPSPPSPRSAAARPHPMSPAGSPRYRQRGNMEGRSASSSGGRCRSGSNPRPAWACRPFWSASNRARQEPQSSLVSLPHQISDRADGGCD